MLIEKVQSCTASIHELSALRTNALSIKSFEGAVKKLSDVDSMITNFAAAVEEMNRHDFCKTQFSAEDIEKLREAIIACAGSVNDMSLTINDVEALSTVFRSQTTMLGVVWKSAAKAHVDPIRSYLNVIQSFADNKDAIKTLAKALETGSTAEPSAAIVKTLAANAEKASAITSNFQMSTGVRSFLQKARTGRATFADITPEVSEWICAHQLSSKIKISF